MRIPERMKYKQNLLCLCIDTGAGQEVQGRLYHGYCEDEFKFHSIIEVIEAMDKLFEEIRYPQSTVHIRKFVEETVHVMKDKSLRVMSNEQILVQRGEIGTFFVTVDSRQNASWQGEVYWMEGKKTHLFYSEMDLFSFCIMSLDN